MHARSHAYTRSHSQTRAPHPHPHPHPRPSLFAVSVRPISPSWLGAPLSTLARQWPVGDPCQLFVYSSVSLDRYQIEHYFVDHSNSCLMSLLTIIYCHQPRYLKISTTSICSSFTVTPASDCIFSTFRIPEGWYFHM